MGDITGGHTFSGSPATATTTDVHNLVDNATINAGAVTNSHLAGNIAAAKLNTSDTLNMAAYQVGGVSVIDASRNLVAVAGTFSSNVTVGGTLGVTGTATFGNFSCTGIATFSGSSLSLHATAIALGENSGDTVSLNGTVDGSPTLTAATADHSQDALIGLDGSTTNGPVKAFPLSAIQPKVKIAVLEDQKATTTHGGASVAATWTKRTLNTEVSDGDSIVALSPDDQFTPIAGTYLVQVESSFYATAETQIRLRNVTENTTDLLGLCNYANNTMLATMTGILVADGVDAFEVQYRTATAKSTDGLGHASSSGETEVYTRVTLIKQA